jgi:tRNA modification GTPase
VSRPLDALRDDLLNLLADVEAALDFADEDIEFVTRDATVSRIQVAIDRLEAVHRQLDARTVSGRPVRVALVGRPNAGRAACSTRWRAGRRWSARWRAPPATT